MSRVPTQLGDDQLNEVSLAPNRHDPFPVAEPYHGIYASSVEAPGNSSTLYVSGQVGVSPDGFLDSGFSGQCRQAFENLFAILRTGGLSPRDLVKMSFFLTRPSDMDELVQIRRELVGGVRPAVTTLFVNGLVSPDWLIEIEAIAVKTPLPRGLGLANY